MSEVSEDDLESASTGSKSTNQIIRFIRSVSQVASLQLQMSILQE